MDMTEVVAALEDLRDGQTEQNEQIGRMLELQEAQAQDEAINDENTESLLEDIRSLLQQLVEATGTST